MEEVTSNKKIYELGYHVMPNLSEEELAKVVEGIKGTLATLGAEIIADQYPQAMTLAYDITKEIDNKNRKFGSSFFGWVKFEMAGSVLEEFQKSIEKNLNILRFLLIKTVRESTLAAPKLAQKHTMRRVPSTLEEGEVMNTVEVDKKIDEIIAEDALEAPLK